jgi:hypothetical protein
MAEADLIAEYLVALRGSLRWHGEVDDLITEAEDHLRFAAARLETAGVDVTDAQRQVLDRFGDAPVVARSHALTSSGGIAMPTRFTHAAGTSAVIAAVAWLLAIPAGVFGATELLMEWQVSSYMLWASLVLIASVATTITMLGLLKRAGGARDALAVTAMVVAVLATLLLAVFTWGWIVGAGLLAIAFLVTILRVHSAGLGSGPADWLLVLAWPIAIGLALLLARLQVGPIDSYGDYPVSHILGFGTGCILFAIGLLSTGRWLRGEEPVELPETVATA